MVAYHRSSALHAYVLAVSAVGLCLVVLFAVTNGPAIIRHQPPLFWVLLASLLVIESLPIRSKAAGGTQEATTAEAFAFLLGWGTEAATLALALAVLVSDLLRRAAPEKVLFNVGQYSLLMAAAGGVYELLGGDRPFVAQDLLAFAAAALVYFIGNLVLVGLVTTLAHKRDFLADLKECVRAEAWPYAMVFGMAPIMLVVGERSIGLFPLLLLPMFAVRDALRTAEEAEELRLAAERAASQAEAVAAEQARLAEAEHAL